MARRPNLTKHEYIQTYERLVRIIQDDSKQINDCFLIDDSTMIVNYKAATDYVPTDAKANVVIASFTTAYARLELYKYISVLGDRLLYAG